MPKKIAVLGGGIAGLTAAYYLSRTPALRDEFEVTVYQMGWRLGGKLASGRDMQGRSLEHGLHVWFGCYDNAFRMLQEVYAARPAGARFQAWTDAVKPQPFTPIGVLNNSGWSYWPVTWPSNNLVPGVGGVQISLWGVVPQLVGLLRQTVEDLQMDFPLAITTPEAGRPNLLEDFFDTADALGLGLGEPGRALAGLLADPEAANFLDVLRATHLWTEVLAPGSEGAFPKNPDTVVDLLALLNNSFKAGPGATAVVGTAAGMVRELLDISQAFTKGLFEDVLMQDSPFEALDANNQEFRDWLVKHGADEQIVHSSSIVRALYDTAFQYIDGDTARPSYAAGTAVGVLVRLLCTYKGDMLWEIQAGMGEAVIAPLYEALLAAGVKFRFFRKVTRLELTPDKTRIERVHLDRQADMVVGDYRPTFDVGGLTCWRAEPDWAQLVNGQQLQADRTDFESHWCTTTAGAEVLQVNTDFDGIVLAISMGAYKPLNNEPGMCQELIAASQNFRDFVERIPIVPTLSVQLWCSVTTAALGWDMRKPAAVAGPAPLSVWADMSQVLTFETWLNNDAKKPMSLHYLTGTFSTPLFRQPATAANTPAQARDEVERVVVNWLETSSLAAWDVASDGVSFRWDMLTDPNGGQGSERLAAQYLRANISPTECCSGTPAGSAQFRLGPIGAGVTNLFLAGEAARSGCDTSSVEGAVMTGMAAARAITGAGLPIVGYEFLTTPPSRFPLQE